MTLPRPIEEALHLTIPQLRTAVRKRLRENKERGRGPTTRWQLAGELGYRPNEVYMLLAGTKANRRLRVAVEAFVLKRRRAAREAASA